MTTIVDQGMDILHEYVTSVLGLRKSRAPTSTRTAILYLAASPDATFAEAAPTLKVSGQRAHDITVCAAQLRADEMAALARRA